MDEAVTITVKFDPHRLSPNQRYHWAKRNKLRRYAEDAARLAWLCAGSPKLDQPVDVSLLVRRGRVLDPDNALGGMKACLDSLFKGKANGWGVTPDDSAQWVAYLPVQFETGKQWRGREEVVVTITPRER